MQLLGVQPFGLSPPDRAARCFELLTPRTALTSYRFGTGTAEHLFCSVCGIKSFYQPRSHACAWSVNFHCLDDGHDLKPTITVFDGRDWEAARAGLD